MTDLTHDELLGLLDYNPQTGVFKWKVRTSLRIHVGDVAGCPDNRGYVTICIKYKQYWAHRLAWFYVHGRWPAEEIDHRFGVRADTRIKNLREASSQENKHNIRKPPAHNTSGFLGVSLNSSGRKWRAGIRLNRKNKHLGVFDTKEQASAAYLAAKARLHPFAMRG